MNLDKNIGSDTAIASESEDETILPYHAQANPAPGPFNRSRGSRGSSNSSRPLNRSGSNMDVDNIHQFVSSDDISPAQLYATDSGQLFHAGKLCVVLVGLPARGKTHHSVALTRYLRWLGVKTHAFHLGDYRRKLGGPDFKVPNDYFLPNRSPATAAFRQKVLDSCMSEIFSFFDEGGQVAIYDAVNASVNVRKNLVDKFVPKNIRVLFVECIATDDHLVARNVRDVKLSSPDFQGVDYKDAVRSYLHRIELRIPHYEPMGGPLESEYSYIKLINGVEQIKMNHAPLGYLQNRIVFYLMNTHIKSGNYYFARAGQGEESELTYRDDSPLSKKGHDYAKKLKQTLLQHLEDQYASMLSGASTLNTATPTEVKTSPLPTDQVLSEETIAKRLAEAKMHAFGTDKYTTPTPTTSSKWTRVAPPERKPLIVWSSKRMRTVETAKYFADDGFLTTERTELTQLNPGDVDGLTIEQIKAKYPDEYQVQLSNPYHHRYPRSESYHDVAVRLEPLIMETERHEGDLLIIAHESVLRVLYGYLMASTVNDIPVLKFPKNEIVEIKPGAYYNTSTRIPIGGVDP